MTTKCGWLAAIMAVAAAFVLGIMAGPAVHGWIGAFISPKPDKIEFHRVDFSALPGWEGDRLDGFLPAFLRSCNVISRWPDSRPVSADGRFGQAADWKSLCADAAAIGETDGSTPVRGFIESRFQPVAVSNNGDREGLFTGYYEPELRGSLTPDDTYHVPLHSVPQDLVMADLGAFRESLRGIRIAGRVDGHRLRPAATRAEVAQGALAATSEPLVWVDDPVDAFFLHIQGSGRVRLTDGRTVRVAYAGHNGHPYVAIGRYLMDIGVLTREEVSMQSIRAWLNANPGQRADVFARNPSYIFFRLEEVDDPALGPSGAQAVPLTPGRSLAVDRRFHPLGIPVWLDAEAPTGAEGTAKPLRRLLVAQDTGGAITGPVRGDVFWGFGPQAAEIAGRMKHQGRMFLLLPRTVSERLNGHR